MMSEDEMPLTERIWRRKSTNRDNLIEQPDQGPRRRSTTRDNLIEQRDLGPRRKSTTTDHLLEQPDQGPANQQLCPSRQLENTLITFSETMADERSPSYLDSNLLHHLVKSEASADEEEKTFMQVIYRCPHKRDQGARCCDRQTDFNLSLNHFYKHHAKERLLSGAKPKFPMCCFRERCPAKFVNHIELVKHMFKHDDDPAENIFFVEYIKDLYEKENKHLDLQVNELLERVNELNEQVTNLESGRNNMNSKLKQKLDLELEELKKDKRHYKKEIEELTKYKEYYRNKYHSVKNLNNLEEVQELKEHVNNLKAEKNILEMDNTKIKEINELKMKNIELELEQKKKDLNKQEVQIEELKRDKNYYQDEYESEKKKNMECKLEIEKNNKNIEKLNDKVLTKQEYIKDCLSKNKVKVKIIEELEEKNKELEANLETSPSSTNASMIENSANKMVEEKNKKIKDMKRKEKVLKKQVVELKKTILDMQLKMGSSTDSDDNTSGLDEKMHRKEKLHKIHSKGRKKRDNTEPSSDESSDTEERNGPKKKRRHNNSSHSAKSNTMEKEYVEGSEDACCDKVENENNHV